MNPQVIAHRGWSHNHPENTQASLDAALTLPIHGLEFDLQLSKDETVVIYHDRTLSKLGLPRKTVSQLTWKELRSLDAGSWFSKTFQGERLLTLEALLKRYARKTMLCLEIKARGGKEHWEHHQKIVRAAVECVQRNNAASNVLFLCFHEEVLYEVLKQAPTFRCVWNLEKQPAFNSVFLKKMTPFFGLCFNVKCLTPDRVTQLHQKNKKVFTYTCNSQKTLRTAIRCGVDAVLSDKPDWVLQCLD